MRGSVWLGLDSGAAGRKLPERDVTLSDGTRIHLKAGQALRSVRYGDGDVDHYMGTPAELARYEERFRELGGLPHRP